MQKNLNKIHNRLHNHKIQDFTISKIVRLTKLNPTNVPILLQDYIKTKRKITDKEKDKINYFIKHKKYKEFNKWYNEQPIDFERNDIIYNIGDDKIYNLKKLLYSNLFIPIEIVNFTELYDLYCCTLESKDKLTKIYFFCFDKDLLSDKRLKDIFDIVEKVSIIFNKKIKLTIRLLFSDFKKELDLQNQYIGIKHVNSGSSIPSTGEINLWRKEELGKVLIHELVHAYERDYAELNKLALDYTKYSISGLIRPNEAYTETLTLIIIGILMGNKNYNSLRKMLKDQIPFFAKQWLKILKHYNINFKEFIKGEGDKLKQTTAVMSYYFLKTNLVDKLDNFVDLLDDELKIIMNIINYNKLNELMNYTNHELFNYKIKSYDKSIKMTVFL